MEPNYKKQGAAIVRNCPDIFLPIRDAIIRILKLRFPDMPFDKWPDEIGAFSKWIGETYRDHRKKILHVYDVLDRSLEILSNTPIQNIDITNDVPPKLINVNGIPVTGNNPITTPIFKIACTTNINIRPIAR